MYEAAAKTPISSMRELAEITGEHDTELICTPVLGQKFRKMRSRIDVEIETRLVSSLLLDQLKYYILSEM